MLSLLLFVELELARQLDIDIVRPSILTDNCVHQLAQLVEANMDGGVGDFTPLAFQFVAIVLLARRDLAGEHFAVIGQFIQALASSIVAVMIACVFRCLGISDDIGFELFEQRRGGGKAEAAMPVRQVCIGDSLRGFAVQPVFRLQPGKQLFGVLFFQKALDDRPLLVRREGRPVRAEAILVHHLGAHLVTDQILAVLAFLVEAFAFLQLDKPAECLEGDLLLVL